MVNLYCKVGGGGGGGESLSKHYGQALRNISKSPISDTWKFVNEDRVYWRKIYIASRPLAYIAHASFSQTVQRWNLW